LNRHGVSCQRYRRPFNGFETHELGTVSETLNDVPSIRLAGAATQIVSFELQTSFPAQHTFISTQLYRYTYL